MAIRYRVTLTQEERDDLERFSKTGTKSARSVLLARALLLLDAGELGPHLPEQQVSQAVGLSCRPLERLKKRFVEEGLEASLQRKERETPPRKIVFDGAFEARLLTVACSAAPAGRTRWTVRLLAEKLVEMQIVPAVSAMTVCKALKKMNFDLTSASTGKSRRTATRSS